MEKATKSNLKDFSKLVTEAEASVSAVKDPDLRRVAFEKILETLLKHDNPEPREHKAHKPKRGSISSGKSAKQPTASGRQGPKGRVEALVDDGFFKEPRTITEVKAELANQGHHIALTSLSGPLQKLTQERLLRRQRITGVGKGAKVSYAYSNW